jgi:hypothetical protein
MSLFQTVLNQIKERLSVQEHDLESIAKCISDITHVPVTASNLQIKKGTLVINVPPTLKLAILARREAVLQHCKQQMIHVYAIA